MGWYVVIRCSNDFMRSKSWASECAHMHTFDGLDSRWSLPTLNLADEDWNIPAMQSFHILVQPCCFKGLMRLSYDPRLLVGWRLHFWRFCLLSVIDVSLVNMLRWLSYQLSVKWSSTCILWIPHGRGPSPQLSSTWCSPTPRRPLIWCRKVILNCYATPMAPNAPNQPRRRQEPGFHPDCQWSLNPLVSGLKRMHRDVKMLPARHVLDMTGTPGRIGWLCIEITLPRIIFFLNKSKILQVLIYKNPIFWPHCIL